MFLITGEVKNLFNLVIWSLILCMACSESSPCLSSPPVVSSSFLCDLNINHIDFNLAHTPPGLHVSVNNAVYCAHRE